MTDKQVEVLRRCITGAKFYDLDQDVVNYLIKAGLCEMPRLDPPVVYTTEKGKSFLDAKEKQTEEMAENDAKEKSEKHEEHSFQIKLMLASAAIGALLTLFVEHFGEIIKFICSFFR